MSSLVLLAQLNRFYGLKNFCSPQVFVALSSPLILELDLRQKKMERIELKNYDDADLASSMTFNFKRLLA